MGELPRLDMLQLSQTGLETLSAAAFGGLGSLQVLVLDREEDLMLDDSLQEHSPQMPQYIYILTPASVPMPGWGPGFSSPPEHTYM